MRTQLVLAGLVAALLPSPVAAQDVIEYYGVDAVGSVRVVFDSAGNLVNRMDYGPFGEQLAGSAFSRRIYAQLFRDGETGQDHAQTRSYLLRTGRFNAPDTVFSAVAAPQRWNRYSYARNNPVSYIDPQGTAEYVDGPPRFTDGVTVTAGFMHTPLSAVPLSQWGGSYGGSLGGQRKGSGGKTTPSSPTTTTTTPTTTTDNDEETNEPENNDCEKYVDELTTRMKIGAGLPLSARLGNLVMQSADMMYVGYFDLNNRRGSMGFKDELVLPGGQGNDVYKHLNFAAGARNVFPAAADGLAFSDAYETYMKGHRQGPAELAADRQAGGLASEMLFMALFETYTASRMSMKTKICK